AVLGPGERLGRVDLNWPSTASRRGLLQQILMEVGVAATLPAQPPNEDLVAFAEAMTTRVMPARLALLHFERAADPARAYGIDLFVALRELVSTQRKLRLLVQSRTPFPELMLKEHSLSPLESQLRLVELSGGHRA